MSDESSDDSQKTEDPTPKKLEESRKRGQVAVSREVNNWIMLLAGTILIGTASSGMMSGLTNYMKAYIEHAHDMPQAPGGLGAILSGSFWSVMGFVFLPLIALVAAAFLGPFMQIGPLFAPEVIKPDLSKISPIKGFSRLFSMRSIVEFVKGLVKISLIGAVGYILLYPFYGQIEHMVGLPMTSVMDEMLALILRLMSGVLVVLMVLAVIDVLYQRIEHNKKMRMTKQEIKDEYKQTEGDPHVKAKLRQLRQEKARQRMMAAVPQATVVITNPTHFAVALKYDPDEMEAPICVAKGVDDIALKIRKVAEEHKVTVVENPPLARVLYKVIELDDVVPQEHYKAVAEVISYVFKLQGRLT